MLSVVMPKDKKRLITGCTDQLYVTLAERVNTPLKNVHACCSGVIQRENELNETLVLIKQSAFFSAQHFPELLAETLQS